jgi:hypothetical protein
MPLLAKLTVILNCLTVRYQHLIEFIVFDNQDMSADKLFFASSMLVLINLTDFVDIE